MGSMRQGFALVVRILAVRSPGALLGTSQVVEKPPHRGLQALLKRVEAASPARCGSTWSRLSSGGRGRGGRSPG